MEHRLGRTLRVFLLVLAAAGLYRLAVVPLVEPRARAASVTQELSPAAIAAAKARADRRLAQVSTLFAPGSWELEGPNMLESRQMRLLFKEYRRMSEDPLDPRVQLFPCTLVLLPEQSGEVGAPAGRTVVLRAPQGAVLEFDEPFDLSKQERPSRLVGGSLRGHVTIRATATARPVASGLLAYTVMPGFTLSAKLPCMNKNNKTSPPTAARAYSERGEGEESVMGVCAVGRN